MSQRGRQTAGRSFGPAGPALDEARALRRNPTLDLPPPIAGQPCRALV